MNKHLIKQLIISVVAGALVGGAITAVTKLAPQAKQNAAPLAELAADARSPVRPAAFQIEAAPASAAELCLQDPAQEACPASMQIRAGLFLCEPPAEPPPAAARPEDPAERPPPAPAARQIPFAIEFLNSTARLKIGLRGRRSLNAMTAVGLLSERPRAITIATRDLNFAVDVLAVSRQGALAVVARNAAVRTDAVIVPNATLALVLAGGELARLNISESCRFALMPTDIRDLQEIVEAQAAERLQERMAEAARQKTREAATAPIPAPARPPLPPPAIALSLTPELGVIHLARSPADVGATIAMPPPSQTALPMFPRKDRVANAFAPPVVCPEPRTGAQRRAHADCLRRAIEDKTRRAGPLPVMALSDRSTRAP